MGTVLRTRLASVVIVLLAAAPLASAQEGPKKPDAPEPDNIMTWKVDDLVRSLSGSDAERTVAEGELPRRGKAAVPALVSCLQATEGSLASRMAAARILHKLKEPSSAAALLQVYKDGRVPLEVRGETALALGEMRASEAVPDLIDGLADNMFKVSETARAALVSMGDIAVDAVIDAYKKENAAKEPRDGIIYRSPSSSARSEATRRARLSAPPSRRATARAPSASATTRRSRSGSCRTSSRSSRCSRPTSPSATFALRARSNARSSGSRATQPAAQPYRWKAWWGIHRDQVLGNGDHSHDKIPPPEGRDQEGRLARRVDADGSPEVRSAQEVRVERARRARSARPLRPRRGRSRARSFGDLVRAFHAGEDLVRLRRLVRQLVRAGPRAREERTPIDAVDRLLEAREEEIDVRAWRSPDRARGPDEPRRCPCDRAGREARAAPARAPPRRRARALRAARGLQHVHLRRARLHDRSGAGPGGPPRRAPPRACPPARPRPLSRAVGPLARARGQGGAPPSVSCAPGIFSCATTTVAVFASTSR